MRAATPAEGARQRRPGHEPDRRPALTEQQLLDQVTELAELLGWSWVHFRPARTQHGWRTPVSGPLGKGWPDLVLVRGERAMAVELKAQGGRVTAEQAAFALVWPCEHHVWRPSDWDSIVEALR